MAENITCLPASCHMKPEQALDSVRRDFPDASDVVIIGYDDDGHFFVRSSHLSRRDVLWMAEQLRKYALEPD